MKYKTFRALVITGGLGLLGVGVWQFHSCNAKRDEAAAVQRKQFEDRAIANGVAMHAEAERRARESAAHDAAAQIVAVQNLGQPAAAVPTVTGTVGGQSPEAYLLATLGGPASEEKLKDVTGGQGSKINVYNEGGKWARAKVDHDRDEKWDEKWSLDGSIVVRQISPNDDDNYTRELRRLGDVWSEGGAAGPGARAPEVATPQPDPAPAGPNVRALDSDVLRALTAPVQEKIKDATGSTPYKVNLYSDDRVRWNRLKIDLDRDEKWDEKWTIAADGKIERQVAPADDDVYTETYDRVGDAWVRR